MFALDSRKKTIVEFTIYKISPFSDFYIFTFLTDVVSSVLNFLFHSYANTLQQMKPCQKPLVKCFMPRFIPHSRRMGLKWVSLDQTRLACRFKINLITSYSVILKENKQNNIWLILQMKTSHKLPLLLSFKFKLYVDVVNIKRIINGSWILFEAIVKCRVLRCTI